VEHLGEPRATRYLRKFYPWYVARLGGDVDDARRLQVALQQAETLGEVRRWLRLPSPALALAV
jgi:tRNA-dihydrouridine synthase B